MPHRTLEMLFRLVSCNEIRHQDQDSIENPIYQINQNIFQRKDVIEDQRYRKIADSVKKGRTEEKQRKLCGGDARNHGKNENRESNGECQCFDKIDQYQKHVG